jgi:hypothetical protein
MVIKHQDSAKMGPDRGNDFAGSITKNPEALPDEIAPKFSLFGVMGEDKRIILHPPPQTSPP